MAENEQTIAELVEEMAGLQFTEAEIAIIAGLSLDQLRVDYQQHVQRGRLLAEAEVRRSVVQMAKQGSSPAQKQFLELNRRAKRAT